MESPLKFQQPNSELSHMKLSREVSKLDLQQVKTPVWGIELGFIRKSILVPKKSPISNIVKS